MNFIKATIATAAVITCCLGNDYPANAQINHTGRYYGPNGSYTKCSVIGSQYSSSVFCSSGEAARDEDRRHAKKNACLKQLDSAWDANNPQAYEQAKSEWRQTYPNQASLGMEPLGLELNSTVALMRHKDPAYKAKSKACFAANGFN